MFARLFPSIDTARYFCYGFLVGFYRNDEAREPFAGALQAFLPFAMMGAVLRYGTSKSMAFAVGMYLGNEFGRRSGFKQYYDYRNNANKVHYLSYLETNTTYSAHKLSRR